MGSPTDPGDDPIAALTLARARFIETFPEWLDTVRRLATADHGVAAESADELQRLLHRVGGIAGIIGMPGVGALAKELEGKVRTGRELDRHDLIRCLEALATTFESELGRGEPDWALPDTAADHGTGVLVVEDDPDQRAYMESTLRKLGYRVVAVAAAEEALREARRHRPRAVLLDIELPGFSGFEVCRRLKADPELNGVPVVFVTARGDLPDRLIGLTLGADDYITKPVDARELNLRLQAVLRRTRVDGDAGAESLLDYAAFARTATEDLGRSPGTLALIRVPRGRLQTVAPALAADLRRRDLLGQYNDRHIVALLPDVGAAAAQGLLEPVLARISERVEKVFAGIAASYAPAERSVEELLQEADEALAEARYCGRRVTARTGASLAPDVARTAKVVIAEDDPDIARVLDAQFRAAGYRTVLAVDGAEAVSTIQATAPDVAVIDLMMPKLTGFDVLAALRRSPGPRPRIVVVSSRGREADVIRAFDLGADDYMTKPFSPQELLSRVARLLR